MYKRSPRVRPSVAAIPPVWVRWRPCHDGSPLNAPPRSTGRLAWWTRHRRSSTRRPGSTLLVLVVGIRSLGETFQESVRFSHNVQGRLGGVQPFTQTGVFPREPGDLSLLRGQLADLLARLLARQHAGIALLAPLADQRRVQALSPQIPAAVAVLARSLVATLKCASFSDAVNARRRRGPSLRGY